MRPHSVRISDKKDVVKYIKEVKLQPTLKNSGQNFTPYNYFAALCSISKLKMFKTEDW
jgi:hypothetical protein